MEKHPCYGCGMLGHKKVTCRFDKSTYFKLANTYYLGSTAHQLLVAELGPRNGIPRDGEIQRILSVRGTSSNVPSMSSYAPQQPPPPSGHPPISAGYSSNNQSRRGRGKVLSNLISPRATSSDFLPVTLRFLPDQQETTGGDRVEALLDSASLAGNFIAKRVVSQVKLEHHVVSNKSRIVCSGLDSKCYDISNTLALYVFYFNELLKNVAYFRINAIILESSPIDLLIGRKTIKKFDLFNQVPSQLKEFDEKPITAVLTPLESVKISRDCQPRVALLPTQSITKGF